MDANLFARMRDALVKEGIESMDWEERDSLVREYGRMGFEACLDAECMSDLAVLLDCISRRPGVAERKYAEAQVWYVYEVLSQGFSDIPLGGKDAKGRYEELCYRLKIL